MSQNHNPFYFLNPYVVVWELTEDNYMDDPNPMYYASSGGGLVGSPSITINLSGGGGTLSANTGGSNLNVQPSSSSASSSPGTSSSLSSQTTRVKRSISSNSLTNVNLQQQQQQSSSIVNGKYAIWNRQIKRLCVNNQQFQSTALSTLQIQKGKLQKLLTKPKQTTGGVALSSEPTVPTTMNLYIPIINQYRVDFYTSNDSRIKDCNSRHWSAWYRNPYFHLFIVQTEDLDIYKNHIKPKLRKWVDYMIEREYEYLICYVSSSTSSGDLFKKFSLFGKVYDKLKSDFAKPTLSTGTTSSSVITSSVGSRVIKLGLQHALSGNNKGTQDDSMVSTGSTSAAVKEMYQRIHEGILNEFTRRSAKYEDETKKTEQNMNLPGWQFSQYFIQKEGLSFLLEQFGLFVNSLGIYNQILGFASSERNLINYTNFLNASNLKITNILDDLYENFREEIRSSRISEFEFLNYVFSRQMHLYLKLNSPDQVARLGALHVTSMLRRLEQELLGNTDREAKKWTNEQLYYYMYMHAWAYSSAFCISEECSKYLNSNDMKDEAKRNLYRLCGDIYLYCRYEFQLLGTVFNADVLWDNLFISGEGKHFDLSLKHIDSTDDLFAGFPIISSLEYSKLALAQSGLVDEEAKAVESEKFILRYKSNYLPAIILKTSLLSQKDFDDRFLEITTLVADCYNNGLRNRFYQKLNGDIAAIHFRQGRYMEALNYLQGQFSMYLSDGWLGIATDVLIKMAECSKQMQAHQSYVSSCIDLISSSYTTAEQKKFYWNEMIETLNSSSENIIKRLDDSSASLYYTCITQNGQNEAYLELGKMLNLKVTVVNESLIDGFIAQKLTLTFVLVEETSHRLFISRDIGNVPIKRGKNTFEIEELMLKLGTYRLENIKLRIGEKLDLILLPKKKEEELVYNRPFVTLSSEKTKRKKSESTMSKSTKSSNTDTSSDVGDQMDQLMDDETSSFTTTTITTKKDSLKSAFLLLVLDSRPALTIETLKEQLFLLNSNHYFSITVDTKTDLVEKGYMAIHSLSPNLKVCPEKKGLIIVDNQPEQEININDCSILIPKLGYGRRITYKIPIKAESTNSNIQSKAPEVFNMSFQAKYEKQVTNETFTLSKTFEISFFQPFICKCHTTKLSPGIYMLQLVATCITPKPLQISKYSITPTDTFKILKDYNEHLFSPIKPMEVFSEDAVSFTFKVEVPNPKSYTPPSMEITFSIPTQDATAFYHYTVPCLCIEDEIEPEYSIDIRCFPHYKNESLSPKLDKGDDDDEEIELISSKKSSCQIVVGRSCIMELEVDKLKTYSSNSTLDSGKDTILLLDISANPDHWVISGSNRIALNRNWTKPVRAEVTLIPSSSGHVTLPTVDIIRKSISTGVEESLSSLIQRSYIGMENKGRVLVLPPSTKDVMFGPIFPINFPNIDLSLLNMVNVQSPSSLFPTASSSSLSGGNSSLNGESAIDIKPIPLRTVVNSSGSKKGEGATTPHSASGMMPQGGSSSNISKDDDVDNGSTWNEGPLGRQAQDLNAVEYEQFVTPNIVDSSSESNSAAVNPVAIPISKIASPPPHLKASERLKLLPNSPRPTPRTAMIHMRRRGSNVRHSRTKSEYLSFNSEMDDGPKTDIPVAGNDNTTTQHEAQPTLNAPFLSEGEVSEGEPEDVSDEETPSN
ncbi:hypothetical protein FDP41_011720 [Naegleria fowleri]|uniref:Uncharacterized protein n=1 Tax=Naegleria fowleri TaxID=5763 RepID=A0A6A5C995_NAEFO|nr:uncharacterized protein FDP41_011720 [Naegleria fowleri]KAF0981859.1 hypothetical protein FDP41_011720 [Naegleria fowleri]CAG4711702.1 unnamed protein product [Naegleria fowleri]